MIAQMCFLFVIFMISGTLLIHYKNTRDEIYFLSCIWMGLVMVTMMLAVLAGYLEDIVRLLEAG